MSAPQIVPAPTGGQKSRQDFGGNELTVTGETASTALATQARAAVEARFVMAMQRPRDIELVRVRVLAACKRPLFAETALYRKPIGWGQNKKTGEWGEQFAEDLSIRFAEEAIRAFGNAMTETSTLYDDAKKRMLRLSATDFEANVVHFKDITVEKTVERTKLKENQAPVGTRTNSRGKPVYIVEATEDDMAVKEGARASKVIRDQILRLIPSDIKEEARAQIRKTQSDEDAKDPAEAKRKVIDAFADVGVMPNQLEAYLGHPTADIQPAELQQLRGIYSAIKDGETTWSEVVAQREDDQASPEGQPTPGPVAKAASDLDAAVAKRKAEREAKEAKKPPVDAGAATTPAAASVAPPAAKTATPSGAAKLANDPGALISTGKPSAPAATAAAAAPTVPHNPQTGEVTPDFVMSTSKQRKELGEAIFGARTSDETVCAWFGADDLAALSGPQVVEAIARIKKLEDEKSSPAPTAADLNAALAAAKLPAEVIVEWFGKPVEQLDEEERREAARTIAEAS